MQPYIKLYENLRRKWAEMVADVENPYVRDKLLPVLLENSLRMPSERILLSEDATTSAAVEPIPRIVLPLVRRVVPALIATEIVSVQPLTGPVGAVFYLDFIYKSTRAGITAGEKMFYHSPFSPDYSTAASESVLHLDGLAGNNGFSGTLTSKVIRRGSIEIKFKVTVGASTVELTVRDDGKGLLSGSSGSASATGYIDYFTGGFAVVASHPLAAGNYGSGGDKDVEIRYQYFVEASTDIGEIGFELKFKPVQAENKMLKSLWSVQTMGDLQYYWGEDAEALIVDRMAKEIQLEIDRSIIGDLIAAANSSGNSQTWQRTPTSGLYPADSAEYIRTLLTKIGIVSSTIYKLSFNAQANFIVVSPEVFGLLQSLPEFTIENVAPQGIAKAGTIQGKYRVYVNVFQDNSTILVGYQGADVFDTGYVYAPYIPIAFTPTFFDPQDMTYKRGAIQRYGRVLIRNYYYGLVTVNWS